MTAGSTTIDLSSRHNLPADVASFIGREREAEEIAREVRRTRLVTLTGTGGSGKTRLALRVAAGLVPSFSDGVWLIEFAPLTDSAQVPRAAARALGIRGTAGQPLLMTLTAALTGRRVLLVLDNCEHLIGAVARLADTLLRGCPRLTILATSREPLRLSGEVVRRVPPLALPESPVSGPEALAQIESATLFLDRAQAHRADFVFTPDNAPDIATICRRLDGLPLAIELAAAQIRVLAPAGIAARLDDAVHLLAGGSRTVTRQETLHAVLDWSHALLAVPEQRLFRSLAVFTGSFDLPAAEAIGSGDGIEWPQILGLLTALVEKSLVESRTEDGEMRYRLLEPVRQYAAAQLDRVGLVDAGRQRHARYFLALAEAAEPELRSGRRDPWMARLNREQENLRAALSWARRAQNAEDVEIGLRLAAALPFYWGIRGDAAEGYEWLEAFLARCEQADPSARARALYGAGELGWAVGQAATARDRAEEGVRLFRALGDTSRLAYALQSLPLANDNPRASEAVAESISLFVALADDWGLALATGAVDVFALMREGDPHGEGSQRLEDALARFRALGDHWGEAQMLTILGDLSRRQGDDAAAVYYEEALTLQRRQGLTGMVPSLLQNLGYLALGQREWRRALHLLQESLTLFRDQGDQRGLADTLDGLAGVLAVSGQGEQAGRLLGAAEALRQSVGAEIWPGNMAAYERTLDLLRRDLGEPGLATARAAGRGLPRGEVIAGVLSLESEGRGERRTGAFELTRREREVAQLVAEGLTNRQIGGRLFITEETARLHVKHILQKLGFNSRAQIAAWAVAQGLTPAPRAD